MWVPLVENNEHIHEGADYFVEKHVQNIFSRSKNIDTILLACTHYPLLKEKILPLLPAHVSLISQGEIVANSLVDYLRRHPDLEVNCTKSGEQQFFTTDSSNDFDNHASIFFGRQLHSQQIYL